MRPSLHFAILACTLALPACAHPASEAPAPASAAAKSWLADVAAIADADASAGRRTAIQTRLDQLGITWHTSAFEIDGQNGTNILADVSGDGAAPMLLLGAHSDQVSKGEGATDNASGSATVLALAQRLKAKPLAHHRVAIAFWDLEEKGLLGSKAYVANGGAKPELYVNFDVFAWGDTVWMMTPDANGNLTAASRESTGANGLKLSAGEHYPPTDHLSFLKSGWPAVSYSMVGGDEITAILDAYAGKKPAAMPKVMQVIHTNGDTLAQIDANAAAHGVDAVEAALRRWDAAESTGTPAAAIAK
ncbi:M28 family metallopeptidase [Lysobacter tyrosinilyticus]